MQLPPFQDDVWELYDTTTDWSQAHDLATEMPEKLAELQELWLDEARKYNALPLDDRRIERFNADLAGRPILVKGNSQILFGGMGRLTENTVLNIKNKSHAVTAELVVLDEAAPRRDHRPRWRLRGWSLYLKAGKPTYCYNLLGLQRFKIEGDSAIPSGSTKCGWSSPTTAGGSPRRPRDVASTKARSRRPVEGTIPMVFSADETMDVGRDTHPPSVTITRASRASSLARSSGCRSISALMPRTPTT